MTEHRLLTGSFLHEPKGVETASAGQVYEADGLGSGSWKSRLLGILNLNTFYPGGRIDNVAAANTSFFYVVPTKANLTIVRTILSGTLTSSNITLTIYKNGVAQTPTINVPYTGSGAGVTSTTTINPAITFNAGDSLEVRTSGNSGTAAAAQLVFTFTALS